MSNENICEGCCYRQTCSKNHAHCPYLSNGRCTQNEYRDNYLFKIK